MFKVLEEQKTGGKESDLSAGPTLPGWVAWGAILHSLNSSELPNTTNVVLALTELPHRCPWEV